MDCTRARPEVEITIRNLPGSLTKNGVKVMTLANRRATSE